MVDVVKVAAERFSSPYYLVSLQLFVRPRLSLTVVWSSRMSEGSARSRQTTDVVRYTTPGTNLLGVSQRRSY